MLIFTIVISWESIVFGQLSQLEEELLTLRIVLLTAIMEMAFMWMSLVRYFHPFYFLFSLQQKLVMEESQAMGYAMAVSAHRALLVTRRCQIECVKSAVLFYGGSWGIVEDCNITKSNAAINLQEFPLVHDKSIRITGNKICDCGISFKSFLFTFRYWS